MTADLELLASEGGLHELDASALARELATARQDVAIFTEGDPDFQAFDDWVHAVEGEIARRSAV